MQQIVILSPLFNDETSFNIFAAAIEKEIQHIPECRFSFLLVNDGSFKKPLIQTSLPSTLLHLRRNLGHQKAIAIGLSYLHHHLNFDHVIIMDADGEDKPEDIIKLVKAAPENKVVFAQRASRQNGKRFKGFYSIYKFLFHLLTGKKISFGNFMLLAKEHVARLVYMSEIWSHLAGAILKSKINYTTVVTHRGKRYSGNSKMNFTSLVLHGLGAIGVFIDIIATRLLLFSIIMIGISVVSILLIVIIRFFTASAIPGWATTAFSSTLIVLLQSFLLSLFTIFLYLSSQAQRQFIPANHYEDYVASVEKL